MLPTLLDTFTHLLLILAQILIEKMYQRAIKSSKTKKIKMRLDLLCTLVCVCESCNQLLTCSYVMYHAYENSLSEISAKKFFGFTSVRNGKCGHDKCVQGKGVVCTSTQIPTQIYFYIKNINLKFPLYFRIMHLNLEKKKIILHIVIVLPFLFSCNI